MIYPIYTLNGSGARNLLEAYCEAGEAIHKALIALHHTAPHGRDYQTAPDPARTYHAAYLEYVARLEALEQIGNDLNMLALHVSDFPGMSVPGTII